MYLEACEEKKQDTGIDTGAYGLNDFLINIMIAQQAEDYILIANLIELHMLPFLQELQGIMRDSCDVMFCQENWDENIVSLEAKDKALAALAKKEQARWLSDDKPEYWIEPLYL